jgi:hypothetical protein
MGKSKEQLLDPELTEVEWSELARAVTLGRYNRPRSPIGPKGPRTQDTEDACAVVAAYLRLRPPTPRTITRTRIAEVATSLSEIDRGSYEASVRFVALELGFDVRDG